MVKEWALLSHSLLWFWRKDTEVSVVMIGQLNWRSLLVVLRSEEYHLPILYLLTFLRIFIIIYMGFFEKVCSELTKHRSYPCFRVVARNTENVV